MKRPTGYLRRSRVDGLRPGTVSHEAQEAAVRELAGRHGANGDLVIIEDWGRSGRGEKTHLRSGYRTLRDMIKADECAALYGYSLSRLARSTKELLDLTELCQAHGVPIRLAKEGAIEPGSAIGVLYLTILAAVAQYEADNARERAADASRVRRVRGDFLGPAPFGSRVVGGRLEADPTQDVGAVLEAFRAAGSFNGAAVILNAAGVPTRGGKALWWAGSVRSIVRREAPALVPPAVRRGAPAVGHFRLAGLLHCACGRILTAKAERTGTVYYVCQNAIRDPGHSRPLQVPERRLLPLLQAEAAHLSHPVAGFETDSVDDPGRRAALAERRRRLALTFADGALDEATYRAQLDTIVTEMERLDALPGVVAVPEAIDWSKPPDRLNAALRALWAAVRLDAAMVPAEYTWRVPEWRAP